MLENLYTTKMSSNKKVLQRRFTKIRSKSGRLAKMMSLVMTLLLALALGTATVVMAALDNGDTETNYFIELTDNGEKIELKNEPFVKNRAVYVPRRERFEKVGVMDNENSYINWNNGILDVGIGEISGGTPLVVKFRMEIGKTELLCNPNDIMGYMDVTPEQNQNPPVLKDGVTYIPFNFANALLNTRPDRAGLLEYDIYDKTGKDIRFEFMNEKTEPLSYAEALKVAPDYEKEQMMCYDIIENFYKECFADRVKEALEKYCTSPLKNHQRENYELFKAQLGTVYSIYLYPNDTYHVKYSLHYPNGDKQDFEAVFSKQYDGKFLIDGMWSVFE